MSEQARLRLRSIRTSDELWERISQTAAAQGRSASQVAAEAMRRYVEGGAERPAPGAQEPPGAPAPSPDPHQASSTAPALAPVAAVRPPRRAPADEAPVPLGRPDTCPHPAAARRGGVGVVRHCGDCGQPFGLTGIAG